MTQFIHECNVNHAMGRDIISKDDGATWLMRWYKIMDGGLNPCYIPVQFCPFCGERFGEEMGDG